MKLPSPIVEADSTDDFAKLDYATAREETRRFWTEWVGRGFSLRSPNGRSMICFGLLSGMPSGCPTARWRRSSH